MAKFRKRPIVIEAEQWWPGVDIKEVFFNLDNQPIIDTLEGPHFVSPGDWIITGVKGEKYPCKPDIFAMTYEPVA